MKRGLWRCLSLVLLAGVLGLSGCEQPTADPDEAIRELIIHHNRAWIVDETKANHAAPVLVFSARGKLLINGATDGTWSYKKKVFTLTRTVSGILVSDTTTVPDFLATKNQLNINYEGGLCHFIPGAN